MKKLPKKGVVRVSTQEDYDRVMLILNYYEIKTGRISPFQNNIKFFISWYYDEIFTLYGPYLTFENYTKYGYVLMKLEDLWEY